MAGSRRRPSQDPTVCSYARFRGATQTKASAAQRSFCAAAEEQASLEADPVGGARTVKGEDAGSAAAAATSSSSIEQEQPRNAQHALRCEEGGRP